MHGWPDFTVGGALRQTFDIVKRHAGTLLALSAALYALPVMVLDLLPRLGVIPNAAAVRSATASGTPVTPPAAITLIAYGFGIVLVVFLGSLLATAAVVWVSHEGLYGRPAGFGGGIGRAFRMLPAAFVMVVLYALGVFAASFLLVVPGVMLFLRWSVALPALVVERPGILASLGRSRDLTSGHRWSILGFLFVMGLIDAVVFGAVAFGGGFLAVTVGGIGGQAILEAVGFVVNAGIAAFNGAATAALYFELRRAGEGALSAETVEAFA